MHYLKIRIIEAGQLLEVTDLNGGVWYVDGDWRGYEDKLIVGWQVDMEVELPKDILPN